MPKLFRALESDGLIELAKLDKLLNMNGERENKADQYWPTQPQAR